MLPAASMLFGVMAKSWYSGNILTLAGGNFVPHFMPKPYQEESQIAVLLKWVMLTEDISYLSGLLKGFQEEG